MTWERGNPGSGSNSPRYPGTFLLAFAEAVRTLNWQTRQWHGHAVECLDAQGQERMVTLENLFRRIRPEKRAAWPELIAEFLQHAFEEHPSIAGTDLAGVADQILFRLGPPFAAPEPKIWFHPLTGPTFGVNLVVDFPNTMSFISEEMLAGSGRSGPEWLQTALSNLKTRTPPDSLSLLHEDSGLRQSTVGDGYDSSRALLLDELLSEFQEDGFFTIIPARDLLLVLPVTTSAMPFLPGLKTLAIKKFETTPYPISSELFWIRRGRWYLFPFLIEGDKMTLKPPREFQEVLEKLGGWQEETGI